MPNDVRKKHIHIQIYSHTKTILNILNSFKNNRKADCPLGYKISACFVPWSYLVTSFSPAGWVCPTVCTWRLPSPIFTASATSTYTPHRSFVDILAVFGRPSDADLHGSFALCLLVSLSLSLCWVDDLTVKWRPHWWTDSSWLGCGGGRLLTQSFHSFSLALLYVSALLMQLVVTGLCL